MLALALAPTIARALGASRTPPELAAVCNAEGVLTTGGASAGGDPSLLGSHLSACGLCGAACGAVAAPAMVLSWRADPIVVAHAVPVMRERGSASPARLRAQPRAPPTGT